jgi:hypothetical protein
MHDNSTLLVALATAICPTIAFGQTPYASSDAGSVFAPFRPATISVPEALFMPISDFTTRATSTTATFEIPTSVVSYINTHTGQFIVVGYDEDATPPVCVFDRVLSGVTAGTGAGTTVNFTLASKFNDSDHFVVVSNLFVQAFPIVTHWSNSFAQPTGWNHPEGGMVPGESDALGQIFLKRDPGTGAELGLSFESLVASEINPENFNLFDDGSHVESLDDVLIASYERYPSENFDPTHIDMEAATYLSDSVRAASGYPVLHRNYDDAILSSPIGFIESAPIVQIGHAHLTSYDHTSNSTNEQAIATYVLQPYWEQSAPGEGSYPLAANGFYGLHYTVMSQVDSMVRLAQLAEDSKPAVMLFWNLGNGSLSTPVHRSMYMNMIELVQEASTNLGVDTDLVIAYGGSRGGSTALAVAGNPYRSSVAPEYRVPYVFAGGGLVDPASQIGEDNGFTQEGMRAGIASAMNATTPTAIEDFIESIFGSADPANLEPTVPHSYYSMSPTWDLHMDRLIDDETRVSICGSTHDWFFSSHQLVKYVNTLDTLGIPRAFAMSHGWGHGSILPANLSALDAVEAIYLNQELSIFSSSQDVWHYDTAGNELSSHPVAPVVLQVPLSAPANEEFMITITGAPGASWKLFAIDENNFPLDDWFNFTYGSAIAYINQIELAMPGTGSLSDRLLDLSGTSLTTLSTGSTLSLRASGTLRAATGLDFAYDTIVDEGWDVPEEFQPIGSPPPPMRSRAVRAVLYFLVYNDPNDQSAHSTGSRVIVGGVHSHVSARIPIDDPTLQSSGFTTLMTHPFTLITDGDLQSTIREVLGVFEKTVGYSTPANVPGVLDQSCSGGSSAEWYP